MNDGREGCRSTDKLRNGGASNSNFTTHGMPSTLPRHRRDVGGLMLDLICRFLAYGTCISLESAILRHDLEGFESTQRFMQVL